MKSSIKISVVIPALREKENLLCLTPRWLNFFKHSGLKYEIIYVLDGTKENSGYNLLKKKYKKNKNIKLFYRPDREGYSSSLTFGFMQVAKDSDYVVTMDVDNHAPEELTNILAPLLFVDYDIIIGSRYIEGGKFVLPLWKRFLSKTMNTIMPLMLGLTTKDNTSGYRLYKKESLDKIYPQIRETGFECLPELLMVAKKEGMIFKEVPINFHARQYGKSKMRFFKTIFGYLRLFWRRIL